MTSKFPASPKPKIIFINIYFFHIECLYNQHTNTHVHTRMCRINTSKTSYHYYYMVIIESSLILASSDRLEQTLYSNSSCIRFDYSPYFFKHFLYHSRIYTIHLLKIIIMTIKRADKYICIWNRVFFWIILHHAIHLSLLFSFIYMRDFFNWINANIINYYYRLYYYFIIWFASSCNCCHFELLL